jgi:chemotaxis response regulator CheB
MHDDKHGCRQIRRQAGNDPLQCVNPTRRSADNNDVPQGHTNGAPKLVRTPLWRVIDVVPCYSEGCGGRFRLAPGTFKLVAIAASAGGLTALSAVLSRLSVDFPVPVAVVSTSIPITSA